MERNLIRNNKTEEVVKDIVGLIKERDTPIPEYKSVKFKSVLKQIEK